MSAQCGNSGSTQCDLGLAKADITAHQSVHRHVFIEVTDRIFDRLLLIFRFRVGEAGGEFLIHIWWQLNRIGVA